MTKTLFRAFCIAAFVFINVIPYSSFADKYIGNKDEFILNYLKKDKYPLDTSASAIVLYECTSYDVVTGEYNVRKIIKIIKKTGAEYGNIAISLVNPERRSIPIRVKRLHGTTYNLDGDKVINQEIDKDNIDLKSVGRFYEKKISMPAIREGSVIDYSYEIDGMNFSKWDVQESIPKLYSKLELSIPKEIDMATEDNIVPVFINVGESKGNSDDKSLPYSYTYDGLDRKGQAQQTWVRRNIPSFDDEPYLPCESNYREFMEMYVKSERIINFEDLSEYEQFILQKYNLVKNLHVLNTWDKINEDLVESYYFYRPINSLSGSINNKADELAGNDKNQLSVAKKIYKYVRDNVGPATYPSMFSGRDLGKIFDAKAGNSTEVNLLLIAMLRYEGISCSPVILATKDNATPTAGKVELLKYNYTICLLRVNGEKYYLDAAEKYNPFGRIPPYCLNGYARVIDKNEQDTCGVTFTPDMAKEKALYSVTTTNSDIDNYTLNFKLYYGDEASIDKRTEWIDDTTKIKKYILSFLKDISLETKLVQYKVSNLSDPEKQLTLDFSISIAWPKEKGATVYLNPYFINFFGTNPFKDAKRKYPVELPGTQNLTYTVNLKLPEGFEIDEMPKSDIIKIGSTDQYKNLLDYNKESNTLSIDSRLQMQHIFYPVNEYDVLREFFQKMGDEQQKTLVVKKL